jgi:YtcA family
MIFLRDTRSVKRQLLVFLIALLLAGCSRAPSFDIMGSFFPAWLICLAVALLLTVLARWLLLRLRIALLFPVLVYPSLTALFTFALWLAFFR